MGGILALALTGLVTPGVAWAAGRDPLVITLGIGAQYDSNVSVDEADLSVHKGDSALLTALSVRYTILDERKASLRVGYSFDDTRNADLTDLDVQVHAVSGGATYRLGRVQLGLDGQYSHVLLDDDRYLDMQTITPSVSGFATDRLFLRAAYSRQRKRFVRSASLDADTDSLALDAYRFFARRKGYVALGLRLDDEDASGPQYRYRAVQASLRAQVPLRLLGPDARLRLGASHGKRDYREITPAIGRERFEKRTVLNAALDIPLTKALTMRPQVRYTDRQSNLPAFDYREHVLSSMLTYRF